MEEDIAVVPLLLGILMALRLCDGTGDGPIITTPTPGNTTVFLIDPKNELKGK
jgi:hypothetical protein